MTVKTIHKALAHPEKMLRMKLNQSLKNSPAERTSLQTSNCSQVFPVFKSKKIYKKAIGKTNRFKLMLYSHPKTEQRKSKVRNEK